MVRKPKYQQVFDVIKEDILAGRYKPGEKLLSEGHLVDEFGASRITIIRSCSNAAWCSVALGQEPT
jgi:DNA-binding GntR family transcriptional regulator